MIAIVDYDAGNTRSVINALHRLEADYVLTDNIEKLIKADKVILPGVGHAGAAMQKLNEKNLIEFLKSIQKPFLGVCVGMQLLYDHSEEGDTSCLGMIPGEVIAFKATQNIKVPHMGWNDNVIVDQDNAELFSGINKIETYFVHSYYAERNSFTVSACEHSITFASSVKKNNCYGLQFHPEKSGDVGEQILKNFLLI